MQSTATTDRSDIPLPNPILTRYQNVQYIYHADINEAVLTTDLNAVYLLLMNKVYTLGEGYVPANLTTLTCPTHYDEALTLESGAALALYEMFREMEKDGVDDLMVTSAYRSYEYQYNLYNYYVRQEKKTISEDAIAYFGMEYIQANYLDQGKTALSEEDAHKVVQSYSARAGTSEHQTGLCVDFITSKMSSLTVAFEKTQAFAWLSKNAYRFGFILRYPKGKEDITGYTYEPWHYRFVGREAATNIYFADLTLEEYLEIAMGY